MWNRTLTTVAALVIGFIPTATALGQGVLALGLDTVQWENNIATGPLLYREVPETDFVSVRAKISSQTPGFWSLSGVIVRAPNLSGLENWQTAWSFRAPSEGPFTFQTNAVTNGAEAEFNDGNLTAADLTYVRLDRIAPGTFLAYRGSGPDDNITWTPHTPDLVEPLATNPDGSQTNANLSGVTLQVGVTGGAIAALSGAHVLYDWIEIQTTSQTYRDDFNYEHDLSTGVVGFNPAATSGGAIWNNVENAAAGGFSSTVTQNPNVGHCVTCTWNVDGSGDVATIGNWLTDNAAFPLFSAPGGNNANLVFGAVSVTGPAVAYTNQNVTAKQLTFDNANTYVLGGPGSITLDADSGNALINVNTGSHEIQADILLADNVTATAAAGATLNINAAVVLNGKTFTTAGAGTVNLNNGAIAVGSGGGSGGVVNDGNLSGLGGVAGSYTQTDGGTLAVDVGSGSVIEILGAAELAGVLDVSLASGFTPTPGQEYAILSAQSVTDLGMSLGGSAADQFSLVVGPDSVSLFAIPEPATVGLVLICATLCSGFRRRSRIGGRRVPHGFHRIWGSIAALVLLGVGPATADVLTYGPGGEDVTYRDDFDAFFDYEDANGPAPTGTLTASLGSPKSWTATYNARNGGDRDGIGGFPYTSTFEANSDYVGTPPGKLVIEDAVLHVNTDGTTIGAGWEGDKNNAPFLFANVDAGDNFEATIKIDAQTAGFWSYGGILARRAGTPVGLGPGDTIDPAEAFVVGGSFRTAVDDPLTTEVDETLSASILTTNVGQLDTNNMNDPDEMEAGSGQIVGLPLWVRMTKRAAQFEMSTSLDGSTWTVQNAVVNGAMNTPGQLLEVGVTSMAYPLVAESVPPYVTQYDFVEIKVQQQLVHTQSIWASPAANSSGDWNAEANWDSPTHPGVIPNANTINVEFTDANADSGPATVYSNTAATVRSLTFNSANKYAISGTGSIALEPYPLDLNDTDATFIHVDSGSHEIQVDMSLSSAAANDNRIVSQPGTRLDIDNTFSVNGKTMFVQGAGKVNFNNNIDTGTTGTVIVNAGNLGGSGRVNGNLRNGDATNTGGEISPGQSVGTLTVDGTFTQHSTGTLEVQLAGTAVDQYDRLNVVSVATLDGLLNVKLANAFIPTIGNTFDVITGPNINNALVISLDPADAPYYSLTCVNCGAAATPDILRLTVTAVPPTRVPGDYNGNNVVDAGDYTVWLDNLGGPSSVLGDSRDPDNSGPVNSADYTYWKAHFGETPGSGGGLASGVVPEPATLLLLLLGGAATLGGRRRSSSRCRRT